MKQFTAMLLVLLLLGLTACQTASDAKVTENDTEPVAESGVILVSTAEELIEAFAHLMTEDVITLNADIDMTGKTLSVVNTRSFTLDGNGHTIENYHIQKCSGLFVDNGGNRAYTIKNLTLKSCSVESDDDFAALFVGAARDTDTVTISDCHAIDCKVSGPKYASVFVSYTAGTDKGTGESITMTVSDCSATNCAVSGGGSTGIAIGHSGGNDLTYNVIENLTVRDCQITGGGEVYEGIVIGTAGTGRTDISGVVMESVTTCFNQEEGVRRYYGRNLTTLVIDGQEQPLTNS